MSEFLNPYQFIPVKPVRTVAKDEDIATGQHDRIRHDTWQPHLNHGRVQVRLKTETPTAIGAGYEPARPKAPARQIPYHQQNADNTKQLALPGNSLRGMIGFVIEILCSSNIRVLSDKKHSIRRSEADIKRNGGQTKINTLSNCGFFARYHNSLLPWSALRQRISIAEGLLGAVTQDEPQPNTQLPALASRLRFQDAIPKCNIFLLPPAKLQILSSREPTCPNLYFIDPKNKSRIIKKTELTHSNTNVRPRGRKIYLHHPREVNSNVPGISKTPNNDKHNDQRIIVRAIPKGAVFDFTIDFENLNDAELSLLLIAIEPSPGFQHRLGLGKPLGLGSVKLEVQAVELYDRSTQAYSLNSLHQRWPVQLYRRAGYQPSADQGSLTAPTTDAGDIETLKQANDQYIDQESLDQLITVGDPAFTQHHVCYPRTDQQFWLWQRWVERGEGQGHEEELYEWFSSSSKKQQAMALVESGQVLKPLKTVPHPSKASDKPSRSR